MDINRQKEQFSIAYVRAVAAVAGFACENIIVDDDSVDCTIACAGGKGTTRSPKLDLQLKCTSRDVMDDKHIRFPLEVKNYNELRATNYQVPRILVLVIVPPQLNDWLSQSEEEMIVRHCGYWMSLRNMSDTENEDNVTVSVPRCQQFTVGALKNILDRIGNGGQL